MGVPFAERLLVRYARGFPLRKGKLRLVNALWRAAAGGAGSARTGELLYGGYRVPCDLSQMIQRQLYFFGTYFLEEDLLAVWGERARGAGVVFDIGANAGIYSLAALAANPGVAVHAFEPTPEIAERLRRSREMNGLKGLRVCEAAVGAAEGNAELVQCSGGGDNEGMNYVRPGSEGGATVRVETVDGYCEREGIARVDLMKIDVQGAEADVLRGAAGMLAAGRVGCIFIELNWGGEGERCAATEAAELLAGHGYLFTDPRGDGRKREMGEWLRGHYDVIAERG